MGKLRSHGTNISLILHLLTIQAMKTYWLIPDILEVGRMAYEIANAHMWETVFIFLLFTAPGL